MGSLKDLEIDIRQMKEEIRSLKLSCLHDKSDVQSVNIHTNTLKCIKALPVRLHT